MRLPAERSAALAPDHESWKDPTTTITRLHVCCRDGDVCGRPWPVFSCSEDPAGIFPQFRITFLQYFGTSESERTPRGERFVDNQEFEGAVPEMIEHAENHVLGAMRKASLIEGLFRRDLPEYPQEAFRKRLPTRLANRIIRRIRTG